MGSLFSAGLNSTARPDHAVSDVAEHRRSSPEATNPAASSAALMRTRASGLLGSGGIRSRPRGPSESPRSRPGPPTTSYSAPSTSSFRKSIGSRRCRVDSRIGGHLLADGAAPGGIDAARQAPGIRADWSRSRWCRPLRPRPYSPACTPRSAFFSIVRTRRAKVVGSGSKAITSASGQAALKKSTAVPMFAPQSTMRGRWVRGLEVVLGVHEDLVEQEQRRGSGSGSRGGSREGRACRRRCRPSVRGRTNGESEVVARESQPEQAPARREEWRCEMRGHACMRGDCNGTTSVTHI